MQKEDPALHEAVSSGGYRWIVVLVLGAITNVGYGATLYAMGVLLGADASGWGVRPGALERRGGLRGLRRPDSPPALRPGQEVVFDNLGAHKGERGKNRSKEEAMSCCSWRPTRRTSTPLRRCSQR